MHAYQGIAENQPCTTAHILSSLIFIVFGAIYSDFTDFGKYYSQSDRLQQLISIESVISFFALQDILQTASGSHHSSV